MSCLFSDCSALIKIPDISTWVVKNVIDMKYMFKNCSSLIHLPEICKWKINEGTDFKGIFSGCSHILFFPTLNEVNNQIGYNIIDNPSSFSNPNLDSVNNFNSNVKSNSVFNRLSSISVESTNESRVSSINTLSRDSNISFDDNNEDELIKSGYYDNFYNYEDQ